MNLDWMYLDISASHIRIVKLELGCRKGKSGAAGTDRQPLDQQVFLQSPQEGFDFTDDTNKPQPDQFREKHSVVLPLRTTNETPLQLLCPPSPCSTSLVPHLVLSDFADGAAAEQGRNFRSRPGCSR